MYVEADSVELDASVRYRIKNAYKVPTSDDPDEDGVFDGYPYNAPGDFDDSQDWLTTIEIYDNGEVFMSSNEIGVDWSYGMISIGNLYGNSSVESKEEYPWGKFEGDAIIFPANSLFFSMANYNSGGKYAASNPTTIYLSKEAFIAANMKIENFNNVDYGLVTSGEYSSEAYDESWLKNLSKAIDIDEENEESEYKSLFFISDLYTEGYGLAFYNFDGVIRIPENQSTGIEVFGEEVYMSQSPSNASSVEVGEGGETIYTFGLIFHFDDEDRTIVGDFNETFVVSEDEPVGLTNSVSSIGNFSIQGKLNTHNPKVIYRNIKINQVD